MENETETKTEKDDMDENEMEDREDREVDEDRNRRIIRLVTLGCGGQIHQERLGNQLVVRISSANFVAMRPSPPLGQ